MGTLAINGGEKAFRTDPGDIFTWPIITEEDEAAVLAVLRAGTMSGTDVTQAFEKEFAAWLGCEYTLGMNNGTNALHSAMWACGVGRGTEIIAPTLTYWASVMPALNLGAAINFADIDPATLTIDPDDIEHRIAENTRAVVVTHMFGHPVDMDPVMDIARRHGIKVIEDVSHAQGGLYKGRKLGTIGHMGAMSLMSGKSFAVGEAGMITTNDRTLYERSIAFGHYERNGHSRFSNADSIVTDPELVRYAGLPLGGFKHRMHQLSAAVGRVQLKYYDARTAEIRKAMNYFWDLLEDVPGIAAHRTAPGSDSNMGGWYMPAAFYRPEELGGLPIEEFCKALIAEGVPGTVSPGIYDVLHTHPVFHTADIYNDGQPTMLANTYRDIRQGEGSLPAAEGLKERCMWIPWFKHCRTEVIDAVAGAFRKVAEHSAELQKPEPAAV